LHMACISAAVVLMCAGSLVSASAAVARAQGDGAEVCVSRPECPSGNPNQESVLLQVTTGKLHATSILIETPSLPDLPPPFTPEMGLAEHAASRDEDEAHGQSLLQRQSPSAAELKHFQLLKDLRKRGHRCPSGRSFAGIPDTENTFLFDCRLWAAARFWASEMGSKNFFSHTRGGSNPCSRTSDYGLPACGENIAAGNDDPAATLKQFLESDGHCVNMMDPQYNRFGGGYVESPGSQWTHYWTQSMGSSSAGADQSCLANAPSPGWSPAATTTTSPPTFDGPCEDKDFHCAISYKKYCNTKNIQNTCPVTCGLCTPETPTPAPPTPSPAPGQVCEDKDIHCAGSYKQYCNTKHIQKTCPLTCGKCTCEDKDINCAKSYKQYCYTKHIQKTCPLTCGKCSR